MMTAPCIGYIELLLEKAYIDCRRHRIICWPVFVRCIIAGTCSESKVTYNVIYQVCGQVTADIPDDITTREEAVAYQEKNWKNMPFPKNAEYICDSEELDVEGDIVITSNNNEE